jgi:hypothetical protein
LIPQWKPNIGMISDLYSFFFPLSLTFGDLILQKPLLSQFLSFYCAFFKQIHSWFLIWFSLKSIATWTIEKFLLMLNMTLHLKFIYNPKKLWLWQSK